MLPFSVCVLHGAEPETRLWVKIVYLFVIPGNRCKEGGTEVDSGAAPSERCVKELVTTACN